MSAIWVFVIHRIRCMSKIFIFRVKLFSRVVICSVITGAIPLSKSRLNSITISF